MGRQARIIGSVEDVTGRVWDVREERETLHGFNVMLGWPVDVPRGQGGRGVASIATPALARYLADTRLRDVDLPIGSGVVKRLRSQLRIVWSWDAWWAEREADLRRLSLGAFAELHGCSTGAACQRRAELSA